MYSFELDNTSPNQEFETVVDGFDYRITFNTADGITYATVKVDGETVKSGIRCITGQWLIPYMAYAPEGCGNFKFISLSDDYPIYSGFNTIFTLVYYSASEM